MIRLDLSREPRWLDLGHGVRVLVRPLTTALMMAARAAATHAGAEDDGQRGAVLIRALGRLGIQEWEGVGDADGNAMPVSADGVDALLDLWPLAEAFERLYLAPALLLDDEKNA